MDNKTPLTLIQLNNYVKPQIVEQKSRGFVTNGKNNSYFNYVNDCYIGSPTNSAINNGYISWIYGKGLSAKDQNIKTSQYARLYSMLKKKDIKRGVSDYQIQGMAYLQIIRNRDNTISSITHVGVDKIAPELANEENEIQGYFYSNDFKNRQIEPQRIPAFGVSNRPQPVEIYCIRPYQLGMEYFALPTYQSCLQYAELEEEISNYSISHMKNGLSFGYIINIPDSYNLEDEQKAEIEKKIKQKLTGSSRAGTFMINFANGENAIEVTALEINDAHQQWQFLSEESQKKIITGHEVVSPMLFGIKDSSGFSSNADELAEAERQTIERGVTPKQNAITDALEDILSTDDITLNLYFKPLSERKEKVELKAQTELKKQKTGPTVAVADALIELGEDINVNEWEIVESKGVTDHTITEDQLTNLLEFARAPRSTPSNSSKQDTSLFKVRYRYAGNKKGQREFCNKIIQADKVYRVEDINLASQSKVNAGFGPKGADNYDIFKYKGGVNCKHFWQREIYLKKGNEQISVNKARKMILALEPSDRNEARWTKNPKEVAQVAEAQNNFWKLK